jgi:hypothetical protein
VFPKGDLRQNSVKLCTERSPKSSTDSEVSDRKKSSMPYTCRINKGLQIGVIVGNTSAVALYRFLIWPIAIKFIRQESGKIAAPSLTTNDAVVRFVVLGWVPPGDQ